MIVFLHIPKTAGSSFAYYLNRAYGKENVVRDVEKYWRDEFTDLVSFENLELVYGHFHIEKYIHLNPVFVTMLREPMERVISHYYYSRKPKGVSEDISLMDYAELPVCRNVMTKQINSLSYFEFVGIREYFNESLELYEKIFNVSLPERRNIFKRTNKYKQAIDDEMRNHFKKLNFLDYNLYEEGLRIFWEKTNENN